MKVVTAAAALDSGKFTPNSVLSGRSPIVISATPLSNFAGEQFGDIDLTTALTHSVNTVWAQVGERLGKQTMFKYMRRFGFNSRPSLDLPADQIRASGVFNGHRLLTERDPVDIGRVAIGQERLEVTPLQMAEVAATVANGGNLMRPQLWDRVVDPDGRTVRRMKPARQSSVMSAKTASEVGAMMTNVVREGTGTAAALVGHQRRRQDRHRRGGERPQPGVVHRLRAGGGAADRGRRDRRADDRAGRHDRRADRQAGDGGTQMGNRMTPQHAVAEGPSIDGRYRVLRRIGSGGMADVWLAEDTIWAARSR